MAADCKIEWVAELARQRGITPKSWNPVIGCSRASEGCRNCYAAGIAHRFGHHGFGVYAGLTDRDGDGTPKFNGKIDFSEKRLKEPLRWRKPAVVFVGDMADLFHDNVTDAMLDRIFAVMALRPDCLFLVLTKRPQRMQTYLTRLVEPEPDPRFPLSLGDAKRLAGKTAWLQAIEDIDRKFIDDHGDPVWPLPNVWLGVTAENQAAANERIPHLLATPATKRFVSVEPMLGPANITPYIGHNTHHCRCGWHETELDGSWFAGKFTCHQCGDTCSTYDALNWVICGGEAGPNARPMHQGWARSLRDQSAAAGVPFFFKQWGEWAEADLHHHENGKASIFCLEHDPASEEKYARRKTPRYAEWKELDPVPPFTCRNAVARVGKKAAGRMLDGRTWDEVPT